MTRYTPAAIGREKQHLIAAQSGSVVLYDDHLAEVAKAVAIERERLFAVFARLDCCRHIGTCRCEEKIAAIRTENNL